MWIDGRFPHVHRDEVEHALVRWNAALGGARVFVVASDDLNRPREWLALADHPLGWGVTVTYNDTAPEGVPVTWLAQVIAGYDVQFYADHFGDVSFEDVALHEFGHVLGLEDNAPGAHLMRCPITSDPFCIDQGTIALIVKQRPEWADDLHPECFQ